MLRVRGPSPAPLNEKVRMSLAEILCALSISMSIGDAPKNADFACKHMHTVVEAAKENNVRPEILLSLIHHESRWKPAAVSSAGACGLTQVMPKWTGDPKIGTPRLSCDDLKDPEVSITMGAKILSYWVHKYGRGNYTVGLCGYNKGFRCKGVSPNKRGMMYSQRVIKTAKRMRDRISKKLKKEQ